MSLIHVLLNVLAWTFLFLISPFILPIVLFVRWRNRKFKNLKGEPMKIVITLGMLLVASSAFARVSQTNTQETVVNVTVNGAQGPAGPAGKTGATGAKGASGAQGAKGDAGVDGSDADADGAIAVNVGAAVQWHEWDNHLSLNSGYRFDVRHKGHVIDAMIVGFRFGKSAEDRRIDELKAEIAAMRQPVVVVPSEDKPTKTTIRGRK